MRIFYVLILLFCAMNSFAAAPTISAFTPTSASTGTTVTITGTDFTGATGVSFGGVPASSFVVVSATQITAVVASGSSGSVQVTNIDGTGSRTGFFYISTTRIITDFGGFWSSTTASPNSTIPDNSHMLLAFTHSGTTYATGVNNALLTANGISFSAGNYRALPVAGIAGTTPASSASAFLALAKNVDGSAGVGNTPGVASYSVKNALVDGTNGLDLGTGVTNLPVSAVLSFQVFNIDPSKITDSEPDIILTQIAQPMAGNDSYSFIDAAGNTVGNSFTQDMTLLPKFGSYSLDLFNLTPNTPYNSATAYSSNTANTSREIRVVAVRLSEFGITAANVGQVKALKVTPSGNSDYAFIAYNANAINLPPNVSQNEGVTNTNICSGGTASLAVVASSVVSGELSYSWEESADGGNSWTAVSNGGNYSGATTNRLSITNAVNGYRYRAMVQETGNPAPSTSAVFTITVSSPAPPTGVTITSGSSVCRNTSTQLISTVTGGSNLYYQWESNASGSYQDIPGANLSTYLPTVSQTGATGYRVRVSSGNGCPASVTSTASTVTVTGIASVVSASRCETGTVTLGATATSGTVDWFSADAGGTALATTNAFTTPAIAATRTYYVASSGCASALRVPVVATIHPASTGGSVAGSTSVVSGNNSASLNLTGNVGSIVKWQSSTDLFDHVVNDIANTSTQLTVTNLTQTTQYRAIVQSGSCSQALSSTAVITVSGVLPIHHTSLKAVKESSGVSVQWTAYEQEETEKFDIEKSSDGINFSKVHTVLPTDVHSPEVTYRWFDAEPTNGTTYYRIKEWYRSGHYAYSATVRISSENKKPGISFFPNPVAGKNMQVQFSGVHKGTYVLRLYHNNGMLVHQFNITYQGGYLIQKIQLPAKISNGIYWVEVAGPEGVREVQSMLVL